LVATRRESVKIANFDTFHAKTRRASRATLRARPRHTTLPPTNVAAQRHSAAHDAHTHARTLHTRTQVRATGGLADTVFDVDNNSVAPERRNGFSFGGAVVSGSARIFRK
jgi:hypothetical protein